jgi:hypothetical protein
MTVTRRPGTLSPADGWHYVQPGGIRRGCRRGPVRSNSWTPSICAALGHQVEGAVGESYEVTGGLRRLLRQFLRRVLCRCRSGAASQKAEEQPSRGDSGKNADHIGLFPAYMGRIQVP